MLPNPPHPIYKTAKAIRTYGQEAFSERLSLQQFTKLDTVKSQLPIYILTANNSNLEYVHFYNRWNQEILNKYTHEINKHVIVESGHHIHIDKPIKVIEEMDEFLERLKTK